MSVTVQQLLTDAKRLVTRLRDHDNSADTLISQAHTLNNNVECMKQYHEEVGQLNTLAHQRPRSALVLNIQQENRHIRDLQQENRELRAVLQEQQSALHRIMTKYRQQVKRLTQTRASEKVCFRRDFSQELKKRKDKVTEMAAVMKRAADIDESNFEREQEMANKLIIENQLLKDVLELQRNGRSPTAEKAVLEKADRSAQTDS